MTASSLLFSALAVVSGSAALLAQPTDIGGRKQLFMDHRFVTGEREIALTINSPEKLGPVLAGTKAWDSGFIGGYGTVLQDQEKYRMWYVSGPITDTATMDKSVCLLCYAESTDAIHWKKPNLGLYSWKGSKENNILMETTMESAGVFIDPKAPPEEHYKLLARLHHRDKHAPNGTAPAGGGLYIYGSPDGLRWSLHPQRLFPFNPDTLNIAFYDERTGHYLAYVRTWNPLRRVGVIEITDLLKPWPYRHGIAPRLWLGHPDVDPAPSREVEDAFGTDASDPANLDFYTSGVVKYPWAEDAYFMFPSAYRHFPEPPEGKYRNDGTLDIAIAVSRDGHKFHRISKSAYIGLGLKGSPDSLSDYLFVGMIRKGNEIYQYYAGRNHTHGGYVNAPKTHNLGTILAVRQRLDGFVSANAGETAGQFSTGAVVFKGRALALNMDASATGDISVEIEDAQGRPISGFSFAECDMLFGNDLARTVTWKHGISDVGGLVGRPVQITFKLRLAKLYAFQFTE